jgi:hypothetical protein
MNNFSLDIGDLHSLYPSEFVSPEHDILEHGDPRYTNIAAETALNAGKKIIVLGGC